MSKSGRWRKRLLISACGVVLVWAAGWAVAPVLRDVIGNVTQQPSPAAGGRANAGDPPDGQPAPAAVPSEAERLTHLQKSIEKDRKYLEAIQAQLTDAHGEYHQAEDRCQQIDTEIAEKKREADRLERRFRPAAAAALRQEVQALEAEWPAARDRFNLAIEQRKALQEKAAVLQEKVRQDEQALERMVGGPAPAAATPPVAPPAAVPAASSAAPAPAAPPVQPAEASADEDPSGTRVARAREEAKAREAAAEEAHGKAQSVAQRLAVRERNIAVERKLLEAAQRRADQMQEVVTRMEQEVQHRLAEDPAALEELWPKVAELRERARQARREVREATARLTQLEAEQSELQAEEAAAVEEARRKQVEAEAAEKAVAWLQNPFTPHNVLAWLFKHAPKLLLIVLGMLVMQRLVRLFSQRIVHVMSRTGERGSVEERENRAQTLVGVFRNTASLTVLLGGGLMLFDAVGVPVVPLMGGAAVLGLAVAFGAQNLIRDYFSGFMVLMEDQYGINDVVKIGDVSGMVEKITLRMTVLRDLSGAVHFIPHGTISRVSNMTHGWSRAAFDVGVAYKEDVDRVMGILMDLARQLRADPKFAPLILADPEMLGVDQLSESAVVIKFLIKTRPLQQWPVKREMLRRIKRKFDELGIEIPFPHRTVYHHYEGEPGGDDDERRCAA
jgi:small conductance mechanosensitive channel